ncbi:MAG: histidine kinase [Bacteroidales bacterium]|nr:histidine kinase [Bacteroidales bacterium]
MITAVNRRNENILYLLGWILIIGFIVLDVMRTRSYTSADLLTPRVISRLSKGLLPCIILFIFNNYLLIPRLLLRNRQALYLWAALGAIIATWLLQGALHQPPANCVKPPEFMRGHMRPMFIVPRFLDFIFDLLTVGINLAIALMFQRYNTRLEVERKLKAAAETRLTYLQAQINPHFYMNMLNNIHGMIEIDPDRAQEMVLDMSRLMRYVLYDCRHQRVSLGAELDFLNNYLGVMRIRYPQDKVSIRTEFPDREAAMTIEVPPLIFLVYIENAFKHGISYKHVSFVDISLQLQAGRLLFRCRNSVPPDAKNQKPGIGLQNAQQRLHLIYGDNYTLETEESADTYNVTLSLPDHENKDSDNR